MSRADLAKEVYLSASNTGADFESRFASDLIYLMGAILTGSYTSVDASFMNDFVENLAPDIREEVKNYITEEPKTGNGD